MPIFASSQKLELTCVKTQARLFFFQQLGRKRPRLFPDTISPAQQSCATATQGEMTFSPWETPSLLSLGQAQEISFFKSARIYSAPCQKLLKTPMFLLNSQISANNSRFACAILLL